MIPTAPAATFDLIRSGGRRNSCHFPIIIGNIFQTVGPRCLVALKQSEGGCAAIPGGAARPPQSRNAGRRVDSAALPIAPDCLWELVSRFKTKQGILADALLLQESVKIRLRLLREIIRGSQGRRTVGGGAQGCLQPGNGRLLGTAISHPKIANP
jgi:hypothetical protein